MTYRLLLSAALVVGAAGATAQSSATVTQSGDGNRASVQQDGGGNTITVTQAGGEAIDITQSWRGDARHGDAARRGQRRDEWTRAAPRARPSPPPRPARATSLPSRAPAPRDAVTVTQSGNGNRASVTQGAAAPAAADQPKDADQPKPATGATPDSGTRISQRGNGNSVTIIRD